MKDIGIILAERLVELRRARGMTQAQLAAAAHVTVETVARIERVVRGTASANANPSLETLTRLANALRCPVDVLVRPGAKPAKTSHDAIEAALAGASDRTRRQVIAVAKALVADEKQEKIAARRRPLKSFIPS